MKVERSVISGQMARHAAISSSVLRGGGGAGHAAERVGVGVLEGDVEIGQHEAFGHQRDQVADMGVGVDVVEPHPGAERAEVAGEVGDMGAVVPFGSACLISTP